MRVKRIKRANRILTFFKYNYKIEPPFRVLVDGTFCMAALSNQLNLREQVPKYLGGETNIVTTKCVLAELENLGPAVYGGLSIGRNFDVDPCPHAPLRSAAECLAHLARKGQRGGNKYIVATQDTALTEKLREIIGTPIMYIKYKSILLDKVSEATMTASEMSQSEMDRLKELKKSVFGELPVKKKKKKKGANPLSCKKKQLKPSKEQNRTGERTAAGKRRRTKKKVNPTSANDKSAE